MLDPFKGGLTNCVILFPNTAILVYDSPYLGIYLGKPNNKVYYWSYPMEEDHIERCNHISNAVENM
jgi:hypothetical protein